MNTVSKHGMEQHVRVLGCLLIVGHTIFLLTGVFVFLLLGASERSAVKARPGDTYFFQ
jgi:hypothetical protein